MQATETYTREGSPAVTAFRLGGGLVEVVYDEFTSRGLHNASAVGGGVIGLTLAEGDSLGHWRKLEE